MKRFISVLCFVALLLVELAVALPTLAMSRETSDWETSETVTFNDDGTMNVPNGSMATLKDPIDLNAEDLDLTIKFKAPFVNSNQYIRFGLTADIPADTAAAADRFWTQWYLVDGKFGLHFTEAGTALSGQAYGGPMLTPPEDSTYTLRIYRDVSGTIYVELVGQGVIYHGDWQTGISDVLKGIGNGYLTVSVISWEGPVTATILEVNGKAPVYADPRSAEDWTVSETVSFNEDGTMNVPNGSVATFEEAIDLNAEDLDLTIKFKAPFVNSNQYIRFGLTADIPADTAAAADRFWTQWYLVDGKFGLHFTEAGTALSGQAYGGPMLTPPEDSTYTLRIYRDVSGTIYVELVGQGVIYHGEWQTGISDVLKGIGNGYLTVTVISWEGPVTATILEVNGETPVYVEPTVDPEPEQPASKWIIGGEGNVTVNDDDSASIIQGSMATWNEEIDFAAEDLDLSIKFKAPFVNSNQYIRFGITADVPADTAAAADRFWTNWHIVDGKFGLHYTEAGTALSGAAYGGGMLTPPEDSTYTLRIYRDVSGTIYVELVGQGVIYHGDWQTGISDVLKSIGKGYVTASVISWEGPVAATVLSVAKTEKAPEGGETPDPEPPVDPDPEPPVDPEPDQPDVPSTPSEEKPETPLITEGAMVKGDWITSRHGTNEGPVETEIVYNEDGSVTFKPVAAEGNSGGAYASLNRPIWLGDPNLNVTFRINMDAFHIDEKDNPDEANMQFILSDGAFADNPLFTPEGTDKRAAFRLRVFRSYDDELTFPEGVFNAVNQNIISGVMGAYAGSRFMLQDVTTFNFTIKRVDGFIRFYIDNDSMYTPNGYDKGRHAAQLSDALLAEFGEYAYLSLAVVNRTTDDCQITVKEVNGEAGAWKTTTDEPDEPGNEPDEPGNEPDEPGNEPNEPGDEPNEPGNEPDEPGNEPDEPGNEPDEPGNEPDEPGDDAKPPVTGEKSVVGILLVVMAVAACVLVFTRRKVTN